MIHSYLRIGYIPFFCNEYKQINGVYSLSPQSMPLVPLFVDAAACALHFLRCGVLSIDLLCIALSSPFGEKATARQFSQLRRAAASPDRT